MVLKRREGDICKAYRPYTFSEVVGQDVVVKGLRGSVLSKNHSQCYLFMGDHGCGKTTLARILAMALNCDNLETNGDPCCECPSCKSIMQDSHPDVKEVNAADAGGKDDVRKLQSDLKTAPMFGKNKIFILDEAHRMTVQAQDALLKSTEDMPPGVYVMLCSTEPDKILKTLKDRCEKHKINKLTRKEIGLLVETVSTFEGYYPDPDVSAAVVEASFGSARAALKTLQKIISLGSSPKEEILTAIDMYETDNKEVLDLCKAITYGSYDWPYIMSLYKKVSASPEELRIALAGWFRVTLEKSKDYASSDKNASALDLLVDTLPPIKPENGLILKMYKVHKICQTQKKRL